MLHSRYPFLDSSDRSAIGIQNMVYLCHGMTQAVKFVVESFSSVGELTKLLFHRFSCSSSHMLSIQTVILPYIICMGKRRVQLSSSYGDQFTNGIPQRGKFLFIFSQNVSFVHIRFVVKIEGIFLGREGRTFFQLLQ